MSVKLNTRIDWNLICRMIDQKNLVPVIGNEMYACEVGGQPGNAEKWLASKLQNEFGAEDPAIQTLTDAVEFLVNTQNIIIQDIRNYLGVLFSEDNSVKDLKFPLLEKLAAIDPMLLYINTTPYSYFLRRVISEKRLVEVGQDAFHLDALLDSPRDFTELKSPFVYDLLGYFSMNITTPLLREEKLECLNAFIEKKTSVLLSRMLGVLKTKTLIFIGCSEPSWMMRFLYRNLSNNRILDWKQRQSKIIVVNDKHPERDELFEFLAINNAITYEGGTSDFVNELSARWEDYVKRKPPTLVNIFLSYSHDDVEYARRFKENLKRIDKDRIHVWFDEDKLQSGDNFDESISKQIDEADLFIPLISTNSVNSNSEGPNTVKGEWTKANQTKNTKKSSNMGMKQNYLMPVAIDDVDKGHNAITKYFANLTIADARGGEVSESFIMYFKNRLNIS